MSRLCRAVSPLVVVLLVHGTTRAQVIKKAPASGLFKLEASLEGSHPRLHFTSADIPAIRARGKGAAKFFVDRMKSAFGGYKGKPVTVSGAGDWKNYLYGLWGQLAMNLLWIVEQDDAYADTAKSWALHYVRDKSLCATAAKCDDLVPQEIVTGIALTYDIQYSRLTKSERAEIRARLKAILDLQAPRFHVGQYWTNDLQNNHMHNRISGLGHAALAILGDDPKVDVQKHADLAYHAYQLMRDWMPEDGSTHEGPGYWSYGYHWVARDEHLFEHTTGKTPPATGHDRKVPYYRLYMLAPGMLSTYRVGDTGGGGPASNLEAMLPSIARFKNERAHDFIKDQMKRNSDGFYQQVAWGLLWYDPTVGTKPYTSLPLAHLWPDLDMLSVRSGWDADDVGVVFKCGPPGGHLMQQKKVAKVTDYINVAHDHPDQNSFLIWAHGKMLAVDDGYPKSPNTKLTASHNTLVIDGEGGPEEGTGWYQPFPYDQTAFMRDAVTSQTTAYAGGDASRLYTHGQRFIRHFVFVEGRYVMIIDDLQGKGTGSRTFDWRLHSKGKLTKAGGTAFKVTDGTAGLDIRFLAPAASALTSSFFAAAGTAAPGLSVKTKANETQYLAVIVPRSGGKPTYTADKRSAQGGWAIRVKIDGKTDLFTAAAGKQPVTVDDVKASGRAALVRRASGLELALLARGTTLEIGGKTILASDAAVNLVWRPDATGGQLMVEPPYRDKGGSAALQVGGLEASTGYCVTVDGAAAGSAAADADGLARIPALTVDRKRAVSLAKGAGCAAAPDGGAVGDGAATGDDAGTAAGDGSRATGDAGADPDAGENARRGEDGCSCSLARAAGSSGGLWLCLLLGVLLGRRRLRALLPLLLLLAATPARAKTCTSITVAAPSGTASDITFTFDAAYDCGEFDNGDPWVVVSPAKQTVTITTITPDRGAGYDGWNVNPTDISKQPYDKRINSYDASQQPKLPYAAKADRSVVKAVSVDLKDTGCRPCLKFAAVLTVLAKAPGSGLFRPAYFGAAKPLRKTGALRTHLLPRLDSSCPGSVAKTTLAWVAKRFRHVQLDHKTDWVGRHMHPEDNLPDYGASIATDNAAAALRLMLDDFKPTDPGHRQALVNYVQMGIDLAAMADGGMKWPANGGHTNGRKLPVLFAGLLLGDAKITAAAGTSVYSENQQVFHSQKADGGKGKALYGKDCGESGYWQRMRTGSGSRDCRDPYGYIDGGGAEIGSAYQHCCTAKPWKYTALAVRLLQAEKAFAHDPLLEYADRWMSHGVWAKPDPCAPYDGTPGNYGKTYGPDGKGGCIKGAGRFTAKHGTGKASGHYGSTFGDEMWTCFRSCTPNCKGQGPHDAGLVADLALDGGGPADGPGTTADSGGGRVDGPAGDGPVSTDAPASTDAAQGASKDDGCSCATGRRSGGAPALLLALILVVLLRVSRGTI